jgi:hypothetical protein
MVRDIGKEWVQILEKLRVDAIGRGDAPATVLFPQSDESRMPSE